ncbi:hypothetical protein VTL71DRAFT_6781 [Oculimacula yallundae]|uniref:Rhodopsin domain-containing protein n=1 Tax=Oculimacula yallundae TaxID=86028 RepID=A0ABR4BXW9_9HELO
MSSLTAARPTLSPEHQAARDAETNLPFILGITMTFHALALTAVFMRMYVRTFMVKVMGLDDYTVIAAMVCAIGGMVTIAIEATLGLGRHQDLIPKAELQQFKKTNFFYTLISAILGLNMVKISVAFLLMRFVHHRWSKICLWTVIIFMSIYVFICWGTVIFLCRPVAAFWNSDLRKLPTTKCYSIVIFSKIGLANTGINIFTDVLLATIPVPIIWKLQINRRQKIALIGVLSLGYAAVAMGIIKTSYQVSLPRTPDQTFHQGIQTWGFLQLNISIIAACMPALRPLFRFLADTITTRNRTRSKSTPHSGYFRHTDSTNSGTGMEGGRQSQHNLELGDYPTTDTKSKSDCKGENITLVTTKIDNYSIAFPNRNDSQETILPIQGSDVIVRTTEFTVM